VYRYVAAPGMHNQRNHEALTWESWSSPAFHQSARRAPLPALATPPAGVRGSLACWRHTVSSAGSHIADRGACCFPLDWAACPPQSFSVGGQASCTECPPHSSSNQDRSACLCDKGYRAVGDDPHSMQCIGARRATHRPFRQPQRTY